MPAPKLHMRKPSKYITATVQGQKPSFANPSTSTVPLLPCAICTHLSTISPCCLTRISPSPCSICVALDAASAAKAPDTETTRQIQQDRAESLKLETKDLEAEKDRLKAALEEKKKKKIMQQKVKQLEYMVPRNDFRKRMKKIRKAGEGGSYRGRSRG